MRRCLKIGHARWQLRTRTQSHAFRIAIGFLQAAACGKPWHPVPSDNCTREFEQVATEISYRAHENQHPITEVPGHHLLSPHVPHGIHFKWLGATMHRAERSPALLSCGQEAPRRYLRRGSLGTLRVVGSLGGAELNEGAACMRIGGRANASLLQGLGRVLQGSHASEHQPRKMVLTIMLATPEKHISLALPSMASPQAVPSQQDAEGSRARWGRGLCSVWANSSAYQSNPSASLLHAEIASRSSA